MSARARRGRAPPTTQRGKVLQVQAAGAREVKVLQRRTLADVVQRRAHERIPAQGQGHQRWVFHRARGTL